MNLSLGLNWKLQAAKQESNRKKMSVEDVVLVEGLSSWWANTSPHRRKVDVYSQVNIGLNVILKYDVLVWLLCLKNDISVKNQKEAMKMIAD